MHSMLFVASIPKERNDWGEFLGAVDRKLEKEKGVQRLAENVWLLNVQASLVPLGCLLSAAEGRGIPYGTLPFERVPEWLPAGFDPKTIQARTSPL